MFEEFANRKFDDYIKLIEQLKEKELNDIFCDESYKLR